MTQAALATVRSAVLPIVVSLLFAFGGYIWWEERDNRIRTTSAQEDRIRTLEAQQQSANNTLAVIAATQSTSKDDRQAFQDATTARLDRMEDLMSTMSTAVVRLTTLQEQRDAAQ